MHPDMDKAFALLVKKKKLNLSMNVGGSGVRDEYRPARSAGGA